MRFRPSFSRRSARVEAEHAGLRPLGPHGEGYCPVCRFVVGLDPRGRLERHTRTMGAYLTAGPCKGGDRAPAKRTPFASRKSAFRVTSNKPKCPQCGAGVNLLMSGRYEYHTVESDRFTGCRASGRFPNEF